MIGQLSHTMILATIAVDPEDHPERFQTLISLASNPSGVSLSSYIHVNRPNIGVVPAMQAIYEEFSDYDVIAYSHNDVSCHEQGWDKRVLEEFLDPKVAVVGFGGATGLGVSDMYKQRYDISQLQRIGYVSNAVDWDTHGAFEEGNKDVATVDGFFMAVRTSFLREIGGFKWFPHRFHNYDNALCLMAHRRGYKVRMVGVKCHHHGASYSASPEYRKWCLENGTTMEREHEEPHRWMYEFFRDELPVRIA